MAGSALHLHPPDGNADFPVGARRLENRRYSYAIRGSCRSKWNRELSLSLTLVAVDVRRRASRIGNTFRLLTSAATLQGFNARTFNAGQFPP